METLRISKNELLSLFERLTGRVELLGREEKAFVRLFCEIQRFRPIAKMAGVNEANVARRLKGIACRISSNTFIAALSQDGSLSGEKMEILREHFVNGRSRTAIARDRKLSYYKVRKTVEETELLQLA